MKTILMIALIIASVGIARAESPFTEIPEAEAAARGLHLIEDGEVDLKDGKIKRITVGDRSLTITFQNTEATSYKPNFRVLLCDKYGLPVRSATEYWVFKTIGAGEVKSHDSSLAPVDIRKLLAGTPVAVPGDAGVTKYLMIHYQ